MSAINYVINRLNTYPMKKNSQEYRKEYDKVHTTTESISNKCIKQKLKNNVVGNQVYTKENTNEIN
jgi:hypothetical protein